MSRRSAAKSAAQKVSRKPLPPKIAALLRESWWLLLIGAALYLVLILATYSKNDPGWSHQGSGGQVVNAGGKAGAWIA
ncbi:MAG TPA: DNA translocase FtsK 4TM domain-containing protein, partial [Burkholderiales bacterium]|nr:DNA translocase FtsK 4TM domain-containing protein [Burkholderiales bacterium]